MKKTIFFSSVTAAILLTGCGGGSTTPTASSTPENTGYFVDSAVAGLEYNTSSKVSGTTGELGDFKYNVGDKVTFKVGKVILGSVEMNANQELVTPEHIAKDENATTRILQLLQSLDDDHNASNGIVIDKKYVDELKSLDKEIHMTKEGSKKDLFEELNKDESSKDVAEHIDSDYDGKFDVNETEAKEHFEKTKQKIDKGWKPKKGDKNRDDSKEGNGESHGKQDENFNDKLNAFVNMPKSELSDELKEAMSYMENEERLAYDVYKALYAKYSDAKVLNNIATRAESRHIETTYKLLEKYDLNTTTLIRVDEAGYANIAGKYNIDSIQALYDNLITEGNNSKVDALKVGCKVEVVDVNDLNNYINLAKESNATDIQKAFEFLRDGSYKHYWAFDKQLKNEGVSDGCCSLGDEYCKTKAEYPKESKENENSAHANGNGNMNGDADIDKDGNHTRGRDN